MTAGRPTVPAQLHVLRGNPSKKSAAALLDDVVRPQVEIPAKPAHLVPTAAAEWDRLAPHLERLGLVSQLDLAALSIYCQNYGRWVEVETAIEKLNKRARNRTKGLVDDTPSGYKQISVLLQIANRCQDMMAKSLAHFGLSPASRSRVTASDPQLGLPGMDKPQEGGWAGFPK